MSGSQLNNERHTVPQQKTSNCSQIKNSLPNSDDLHNISSMAAHTTDEYRFKNGQILIYKRADSSDNWHCRIKLRGKPYVRRSLLTEDRDEAIEKAEELLSELKYKDKRGLAINSRKFNTVCRAYLKELQQKVDMGATPAKRLVNEKCWIEKYFIPFLGKYDTDKITDMVISKYRDWRRMYNVTGEGSKKQYIEYERNGKTIRAPKRNHGEPSARTIAIEDSTLRAIFEFARKNGNITREEVPTLKSPKVKANRRPHFDLNQWKRLYRRSMWRHKQTDNIHTQKARLLLHDYILIMAGSGMRPTEAKTLRWCDISTFKAEDERGNEKEYLKLSVRGKGKSRDFVPQPTIKKYFDRMKQRQTQYAAEHGYEMTDEDFVFVNEYGKQIQSFKNGFDALLKSLDMTEDNHGQKYAPYSLRHTYATFRLIYGGVSVYELSQNMGTSVEMIERHYGHLKPEDAAGRMTRGQNEH